MESLVILAPAYEEQRSVEAFLDDVRGAFGDTAYMVLVDDGSIHQPLDLTMLDAASLRGTVITLVRNLGNQRAIAVGLGYIAETIDADRIIIMDSDGEDRPETAHPLLQALESPEIDIVVAERRKRATSFNFAFFYGVYNFLAPRRFKWI